MVGYSEVFQTIGAMVIFSLVLLSATSMIQRNTYMQVAGELEKEVIAIGQDVIEEGRTKEFDENSQGEAPPANIPGGFSDNLGPDSGPDEEDDLDGDGKYQRDEFDDFDDYNGWQDTVSTEHGDFFIEAEVFYVTSNHDSTGSKTTFKKLRVNIKSKFLDNGNSGDMTLYSLDFIRNYYAD